MRRIIRYFFILFVVLLLSCMRTAEPPGQSPVRGVETPVEEIGSPADTAFQVIGFGLTRDPANDELIESNIAYNRPDTMILGESTNITLIIGDSILFSFEDLQKGEFKENVKITHATRQLTREVGAVLIGVNFDIDPKDEVRQLLLNDKLRWNWSVKPTTDGVQTLSLIIYNYKKYERNEVKQQLKAFNDDIYVYVPIPPWHIRLWNFIKDHIELAITVIVVPLIAYSWKKIKVLFKKRPTN